MVETAGMVLCTSRVAKRKERLPFFREFNISCIEDSVVVERDLYIAW